MERSDNENRIAVKALFKFEMKKTDIFKTLRPLGISRMFVYRCIKLFEETGDVKDRHRSGRPRSVRTPQVIKAVKSRIHRNPIRKQEIMAREMNITQKSMSRIIKKDLGLGAFKRRTGHLLNAALKKNRIEKCKSLLVKHADNLHRKILFTDEKIFTVQEKFNKQNDRVYEASELIPRVEKGHHPASVMVWWGVSYDGVTDLHFCEQGVKTSAKVYQKTVLEAVVKPLNNSLFQNQPWTFQQDSAPAHKAKTSQAWLRNNLPAFISSEEWPSGSPDLNPLDYKLWTVLEDKVCHKRYHNIGSLKTALVRAVANFPMDEVRAAIDDWPVRLKACVKAKGGHFE